MVPLLKFTCRNKDDLYNKVYYNIPWKVLFPSPEKTFAVNSKVDESNKRMFINKLVVRNTNDIYI